MRGWWRLTASIFAVVPLAVASCSLLQGGVGSDLDASDASTEQASPEGGCPSTMRDSCNGVCVDLASDRANCGKCGNDCAASGTKPESACVMGTCIDCDPKTIDYKTNPQHCGRCGHSCQGGSCANSVCQKQLVAAVDSPFVIAVDAQAIYYSVGFKEIYRLDKSTDGGLAPTRLTNQMAAYTYGLAPFPGGVALAHTNGASLLYLDGGLLSIDGYLGQYGVTFAGNRVWWTNSFTAATVKSTNTDGTGTQQEFIDGVGGQDIAINNGGLTFWTNVTSRKVMRGDPEAGVAAVANMNTPRNLPGSYRLVVAGNDVVWTEPSSTDPANDGRIMRAIGGSPDASVAPLAANQGNPYYIAYDGTYVFWTNLVAGTIQRIKPDGSEAMPTLVTNAPSAFGIAVDATFVYFTQTASIAQGGGIYRVAK